MLKERTRKTHGCVVCAHLNRVAQWSSSAMHLQDVHIAWLHVRILQRQPDHLPPHDAVNTMRLDTPLSSICHALQLAILH